jgi:hypothetical protein
MKIGDMTPSTPTPGHAAQTGEDAMREALENCIRVIEMQEKRDLEEFHIPGETMNRIWQDVKDKARATLSSPAARDEDAGAGDALHRKILDALRIYRCQHAQYDDDGGGCQLVDVFTPHDDQNIAKGQEELELLADHLWSELLSISPAPPPAEGEVLVWLDEIESDSADVLARLDEIEARANAASEGPWSQGDTEEHGSGRDDAVYLPNDDWLCDPMACVEDAAFIAHARQDIPWLIAQLRARIAGQDAGSRQG